MKMKYKAVGVETADILFVAAANPELEEKVMDKILQAFGIEQQSHETHLRAYLRYLAELNELPDTVPAHPLICELVLANKEVSQTIWALA